MLNSGTNEEIDKYKEMYLLARDLYYEQIATFDHLEEKTSKHLYAFSIPLGALLIITKWITKQYSGFALNLETAVLFFYFLTILSFAFGWVVTFIALKLEKMLSLELNKKYIETFKTHKAIEIYKSLTINYKKAYKNIRIINIRKGQWIRISYWCTIVAFILLMLTAILITICHL